LVRGLDERQKRTREQSKIKIVDYISRNEPCSQAMIVKESSVKDPKVVRKVLLELEKHDKMITSKVFHYAVPNQKKRTFYFKIPFSEKILSMMGKEESLNKIGTKYYVGIKKGIPLEMQYLYKLNLLNEEYHDLKKLFKSKTKNYEKIANITNWEKLMLENLEFFVYIIKSYYNVIDTPEDTPIISTYFNAVFRFLIGRMDLTHSNFKQLKSNSIVSGPIKTIIANMMIEETKSGVMKKLGLSPKLGSKLAKELFNEDGSPKIKVINEINIKSIGIEEFGTLIPSGETLMKKWKESQQDV